MSNSVGNAAVRPRRIDARVQQGSMLPVYSGAEYARRPALGE